MTGASRSNRSDMGDGGVGEAQGPSASGCYGLQLVGEGEAGRALSDARPWMLPADPRWPTWRIEWSVLPPGKGAQDQTGDGGGSPVRDELFTDRARLVASDGDGWIELDRVARHTRLRMPEPVSAAGLVHPYLTSTAAIAAHWLGRTPFHAGAFSVGGRAWGVLGGREMGKSSLLMGLHASGVGILSDDLVVLDRSRVYSGPRCLDLRRGAAKRFGAGHPLGRVGRRDRWRVDLPPVPPDLPLAGWIVLGWSDGVVIELIGAAQRLSALAMNRAVTARGEVPRGLLEATALPVVLFSRPRDWESFEQGLESLVVALAKL